MKRLIAVLRRSKCCGVRMYYNPATRATYCTDCDTRDRFQSTYWRKVASK